MEAPSLTAACISAFGVVFVVLAFLVLVIHIISLVLPARASRTDPAVAAAIAAAVAARQPGAKVVHIVEER